MRLWPFNRDPVAEASEPSTHDKGLALSSVDSRGWTRIFDFFPGAWQSHERYDTKDSVVSNPVVFACLTRIGSDVGKLAFTIEQLTDAGIWEARRQAPALPLLMRPNGYQNHIQFKQTWTYSKLIQGNAYALKVRNPEREIIALHILDPLKVLPLVSESGEVFYQLESDDLPGLPGMITVPSSEIIHDRCHAIFHPLIGLSPIFACAIAAEQGLAIQKDSRAFFRGGAKPSGVLVAPGPISEGNALALKEYWESKFSGDNAGGVAVLGDGLKYEQMRMSSVDAQLIEQLGWTAERICACYHVPGYKVGVGAMPTHDNIEALTQDYYSNCLQIHIEDMETLLHAGLNMPEDLRVQLDLNGLFRMDSEKQLRAYGDAIKSSVFAPNEGRKRLNLPPLEGGDTVYLQQQNYSLEALAKRDATNPLVADPEPPPAPEPPPFPDQTDKALSLLYRKDLAA
jgi:HK97 family phage portal protein